MVLYRDESEEGKDATDLDPSTSQANPSIEILKSEIMDIFKAYMIDPASLVFMKQEEFDKRTKMADKFALSVLRSGQHL